MSTDVAVFQEQPERRFNPNDHIMQIPNKGGKSDYLPVQWRLVWFRELCPQGTIETQEIVVDLTTEFEGEAYVWNADKKRSEKVLKRAPGYARFRAIIHDGKGGSATATKTEKGVDFPDFVEKAETGAVGRALAMLGYGTQFAQEELDEEHRIVDAPVDRKPYQERKPFVESTVSVKEAPASNGHAEPTIPTVKDLQKRCNDLCGAGAWQTMVHKATKVPISDGPILDKDMTLDYRQKTSDYLDFVEQQKAAKKTA